MHDSSAISAFKVILVLDFNFSLTFLNEYLWNIHFSFVFALISLI